MAEEKKIAKGEGKRIHTTSGKIKADIIKALELLKSTGPLPVLIARLTNNTSLGVALVACFGCSK